MTGRAYGAALLKSKTTEKRLNGHLESQVALRSGMGIDGLTRIGIDRMSSESKHRLIADVQSGLRSGTYRLTSYRQVLAVKNSTSPPRSFSVPTVRDDLAIRALLDVLGEAIGKRGPELPQSVIARVKEALVVGVKRDVVRVDVKNFFPSIQHDLLRQCLNRHIRHKPTLEVIMRAVGNDSVPLGQRSRGLSRSRGVPLGIAISSALAELYLARFDNYFGARPDLDFFRFVDDILIFCPPGQADSTFREVVMQLQLLGLEAHPVDERGKTFVGELSAPFVYLGYQFSESRISVGPAGVARMESAIARVFAHYLNAVQDESPARAEAAARRLKWDLDLLVTGCVFEGRHRGWIKFYSQIDDLAQLHHLDAMISKKVREAHATVSAKRIVKTWHLVSGNSLGNGYVPDLDRWDVAEMREHLVNIAGWDTHDVQNLADNEVERVFNRRIRREVSRLERDTVGHMS